MLQNYHISPITSTYHIYNSPVKKKAWHLLIIELSILRPCPNMTSGKSNIFSPYLTYKGIRIKWGTVWTCIALGGRVFAARGTSLWNQWNQNKLRERVGWEKSFLLLTACSDSLATLHIIRLLLLCLPLCSHRALSTSHPPLPEETLWRGPW